MVARISADLETRCRYLRIHQNLSTPEIARQLGISNQPVYRVLEDIPWTGKKVNKNDWSVAESKIVAAMFSLSDQAEILRALPGRTWDGIVKRAQGLKVKRKNAAVRSKRYKAHPLMRQLRDIREVQGKTRPQIAKKSGHNQSQILGWEIGKRAPPLHGVYDLADALGYDLVLQKRA